jgi:hypothetical protein
MSEDSKSQIRIASVKPTGRYALRIELVNGKKLPVDLRDIVHRLKDLRALREPTVFARAAVGEGGHSVVWPGDIDIGAARLLELGLERAVMAGWMGIDETLESQGEIVLAGDVRYFVKHLPPVLTDRVRLAQDFIRHLRTTSAPPHRQDLTRSRELGRSR